MSVKPGESTAEGPRELLLACHERIRSFSAGVRRLCEADEADERVLPTAIACHRYFSTALALHAADESVSLMPRLLEVAPQVAAALARMHAEHDDVESGIPGLVGALQAAIDGHGLGALRGVGPAFCDLLLAHIEHEEREIFWALDRLSEQASTAIAGEMRARRGVPLEPWGS